MLDADIQTLREHYESSLWEFAQYINPLYMYGDIHKKIFDRMSADDASNNQLFLLPRDHLKSHCIATWVTWQITREPWSTIIYLSAGEDLATNQMYAIKNMFMSDQYQLLWPEMFNPEEGKRDKWSAWAINTDHPSRQERGIRDNTLIIKTVKSNSIGLHSSHTVYDDVVIPRFAYTASGRLEVQQAVAQFTSIESTDSVTKAVGTRYHPKDLYSDFYDAKVPTFNKDGELDGGEEPVWEIFEAQVENNGTGGGTFLWPRVYSEPLKKWFGFDQRTLAFKKAKYVSLGQTTQFFAQYYNEPNDPDSRRVDRSNFRYYDKTHLRQEGGDWYYQDRKLNLSAGMDIAFTDGSAKGGKKADYTAICVLGIDFEGFIYILELDRFKTDKFDVYYDKIMSLAHYWNFRKIQVETNTGGKLVKRELDDRIRSEGYSLVVVGKAATKQDGSKFERHAAVLEPRYENGTILHYKGGLTPALEEEVILERPPHDDLEDAVCIAIENAKPPSRNAQHYHTQNTNVIAASSRFGGRRMRRGN